MVQQRGSIKPVWRSATMALALLGLFACSGGSDDAPAAPAGTVQPLAIDRPTPEEAARFLTSATFGPTEYDINRLVQIGYSAWFREQFNVAITGIVTQLPLDADYDDTLNGWWTNAVYGQDQLRQRAAFAMSQIFVVSAADDSLQDRGQVLGQHMDVLQRYAFGDYHDLLTEITYSPAMGIYLTYMGNEKADVNQGSMPDENYARELLQLFTIGLVELNPDGTPRLDPQGRPIETFDNMDITGLAKVFTGLWWSGLEFRRDQNQVTPVIELRPMTMNDEAHSTAEKSFLGLTIPSSTPGDESIDRALAHLADHPNTAPFIARQLIQRMVTSNPSPQYIERVATAFDDGIVALPDGSAVGTGERGDLRAVFVAVLLDPEALDPSTAGDPTFGKIREPVVRFAHWARAFKVNSANGSASSQIRQLYRPDRLNQQPFYSPSVFNFYRPGYVAPGTQTAAAGLVAPELQITDSNSVIGYVNFMEDYVLRDFDNAGSNPVFVPSYADELALVDTPEALLDKLDLVLMSGRMRQATRDRILNAMNAVESSDPEVARLRRVHVAVLMAVTSPEFLVQS